MLVCHVQLVSVARWAKWLIHFLSHSTCWGLLTGDLRLPGFKSRSGPEISVGCSKYRYAMRLTSQRGTEGMPVSSLNCDRCHL